MSILPLRTSFIFEASKSLYDAEKLARELEIDAGIYLNVRCGRTASPVLDITWFGTIPNLLSRRGLGKRRGLANSLPNEYSV